MNYHHLLECKNPSKNSIVKFRLTAKKNFNLMNFINIFINRQCFGTVAQYCGNLSKFFGATLYSTDYPILW